MSKFLLDRIRTHAFELYEFHKIIALSQSDLEDNQDIDEKFEAFKNLEWLHLASGIAEVITVAGLGDESAIWCEPIRDEYEKIAEGWNQFTEVITVFNFIWIGYEGLIKNISTTSSKVNGGIHYLNKYNSATLEELQLTTQHLQKLINCIDFPVNIEDIKQKATQNNDSINAFPLRLVGQIRNVFIHNDLDVYNAANDSLNYLKHILLIINLSSKITLLIIQLITYIRFKDLPVCEERFSLPLKYRNVESLFIGPIVIDLHKNIYK